MTELECYDYWKKSVADPDLKQELSEIEGNTEEIHDRFYRNLAFGTGGLRGILGVGSNRMNIHTVQKATQGFAHYLKSTNDSATVAIGYDSRINSTLFARTASIVLASNGIRVFLFSELIPTPTVSFAVRHLQCDGGIVITASHNPAPYNGYKVYGNDGCQITTEAAKMILQQIDNVDPFSDVSTGIFSELKYSGLISYISEDIVHEYLSIIEKTSLLPTNVAKDITIIYSPLCGAGISCVPQILQQVGYTAVHLVPEQATPNGNFPTCPKPNPEEKDTMSLGVKLATETQSDLVLATDPDCDRVGAVVRTDKGYCALNGNEMGVLLLHYICSLRKGQGTMPENPVAVSTIVTTSMAEEVAKEFGVSLISVLTGFKFIGEQIGNLEAKGEESRFIFGFEESYGYLSTTEVRDKDAVNASLLICDMVTYYKQQGETLLDVLEKLYQKHGYYKEKLLSFEFYGEIGLQKMKTMMDTTRDTPPKEILGSSVKIMQDYEKDFLYDETGGTVPNHLPTSNVLKIILEDGSSVVLRPSGTEPKLKIYLSVKGRTEEEASSQVEALSEYCQKWVSSYG